VSYEYIPVSYWGVVTCHDRHTCFLVLLKKCCSSSMIRLWKTGFCCGENCVFRSGYTASSPARTTQGSFSASHCSALWASYRSHPGKSEDYPPHPGLPFSHYSTLSFKQLAQCSCPLQPQKLLLQASRSYHGWDSRFARASKLWNGDWSCDFSSW
jgi:hypothetical protein